MDQKAQIATRLLLMIGCVPADGQLQPALVDFLAAGRQSSETGACLRPEEAAAHEQLVQQAIAVGQELSALQQSPLAERTPEQQRRLHELYRIQRQLQRAFDDFLNRLCEVRCTS